MTLVQFTRNYTDHSNNMGFQFEFFCDKCHNGYRSRFVANKLGMAGGALHAAADLFGGMFGGAANATDRMKDTLRGKAWDEAYIDAVGEAKGHFQQCRRCGEWVCPEVCWNATKGQCKHCSPDLHDEAASIQTRVAMEQMWDKARQTDQISEFDFKQDQVGACPHCNARVEGSKFCPECGKPLQEKTSCPKCGTKYSGTGKFCPECGTPK